MQDIVHHPCLCTVSRDIARLPHAWNFSLVPALRHRLPLHREFVWDKEEVRQLDECAATSKVLLLKGRYVPCMDPTHFSACSLLSQFHGAAFCGITRLYFFSISSFNSGYPAFYMLTRFKWVLSVLYMHLFRTVGRKSVEGLCAHTEIRLIFNQRPGFLCLVHLWQ